MPFTIIFVLMLFVVGSLTANISVKGASYSIFNLRLEANGCTAVSALRDTGTHLMNAGCSVGEILRAGSCFCAGSRRRYRHFTQLCRVSASAELWSRQNF